MQGWEWLLWASPLSTQFLQLSLSPLGVTVSKAGYDPQTCSTNFKILLHSRDSSASSNAQGSPAVAAQSLSRVWLCNPMDWSMPGFPVLHNRQEFVQTLAHCIGDAIQPSHPLSPSPHALNFSQHQSQFQWIGFLHQVAKILEFQHQS